MVRCRVWGLGFGVERVEFGFWVKTCGRKFRSRKAVPDPVDITIRKSATVAGLREDIATNHPAHNRITLKTKKEEICKNFIMVSGEKVFTKDHPQLLGGDTHKMAGGETLRGTRS